ncbi:MAG: hypothetical protein IAG13_03910, partial [Deltaproteobacteria bacterium]|nr:hypothetical protein [Nannocystaceae bacterium]
NAPNAAAPAQAADGSGSADNPGAIPSAPVSEEAAMQPGPEVRKPIDADPGTHKQQRVRTGLFWTGVALTVIGGAALLATGIGGRVTQGQLSTGYKEESLTHAREKTLRDRGDLFNALAGASGGVMIVGAGVTAITFGIDYSRCGTIAKRKRKDCKRKG